MLPRDEAFYFMLAHRGIQDGDSSWLVHAQMLLEHLQHRRGLKRPSSIQRNEEKISFQARQVNAS
jgi:hypothetical protein